MAHQNPQAGELGGHEISGDVGSEFYHRQVVLSSAMGNFMKGHQANDPFYGYNPNSVGAAAMNGNGHIADTAQPDMFERTVVAYAEDPQSDYQVSPRQDTRVRVLGESSDQIRANLEAVATNDATLRMNLSGAYIDLSGIQQNTDPVNTSSLAGV